MSWHFSQALVVEFSGVVCLDGKQFARLSLNRTMRLFSANDKMMEFCRRSPSGMMCEPLTAKFGEAVLMSFLEGFPVKPIPQQLLGKTMQTISGRKCGESWQMSLPGTYLPKTSAKKQSTSQQMILSRWVTKSNALPYQRLTWVLTTFGKDTGYVHTPTCTANYSAPSMQKWKSCKNFVHAFGSPTPMNHEWLMGWPIGWTDLQPLEMDKFQRWLHLHGKF